MIVSITGFQRRLRVRQWRLSVSWTVREMRSSFLSSPYNVLLEMSLSLCEPQFLLWLRGMAVTEFGVVVRTTAFSGPSAVTLQYSGCGVTV